MSKKLYKGERELDGMHWWVEGNLTVDGDGNMCIKQNNSSCFVVRPETIGLFTGREDSSPHKFKIFENDIVLFKKLFVTHVGVVALNKNTGFFEIVYLSKRKNVLKTCVFPQHRRLVVIGNSYGAADPEKLRETIELGHKVYEAKRSKKIKSFTCPIYGRPQYMKFYDSCIGLCGPDACVQCHAKSCECRLVKTGAAQKKSKERDNYV